MSNKITEASENIFSDLMIDDPGEALAKAELVYQIHQSIKTSHLTQLQAARILGIKQPDVSDLVRGKLAGFSLERLIHFLNLLDWDIDIIIKPKNPTHHHGMTHVVAA